MNAQELIIPPERVKRDRPLEPMPMVQSGDAVDSMVNRVLSDPSFPVERIQQILEIKIRWEELRERTERNEARKAYVEDMAEFKKNPPVILKSKHVDYGTGKAKFDYAPLAEVVSKVTPVLATHGFSHRWKSIAVEGKVVVRCIMTHRLGHVEEEDSPPVAAGTNPAMSPSQNMQATISYWQRQTLQTICGVAAGDLPDLDDTQKGADEPQTIGEGQIANIKALLSEVNANEESFLRVIKAKSIESIHVESYSMVVGLLEAKRKHS